MTTIGGIIVRWTPWTAAAMLSHLWQSSLVGIAILALMFAARRASARTRWMIGWIGLINFFLPLTWFTPTHTRLEPLRFEPWTYISLPSDVPAGVPVASRAASAAVSPPKAAVVPFSGVPWADVGVGIWAAGTILLFARWCFRAHRFRRRLLADAEPLSGILKGGVEQACARAGLTSTPRCVAVEQAFGPGILGVFSPIVVLPRRLESYLSDAEIESVLIHEFTHLRRRDALLTGLQAAVVSLFWFDPVVWILNRQLNVEMEKSCDEEVLNITADAKNYASGILKMVRQSLGLQEPGFAGATSVPIVARVKNILAHSGEPHRRWPKFLAIGSAVALVAFGGFSGTTRAETGNGSGAEKILVFRNIASWNRSPDFEATLGGLGYSFSTEKSGEMAREDFSRYGLIIIPGAQWQTGFYSDFAKSREKFDQFVQNGGTLLLELNGAESEGITIPGGASMVKEASYINIITQPNHPAVAPFAGRPEISATLASHGYLDKVPGNAVVIAAELVSDQLADDLRKPTYVEYAFGAGRVIAACQCFHDQDGSHRGPLMPAVVKYAMAREWFAPDPGAAQQVASNLATERTEEGPRFAAILNAVAERKASAAATAGSAEPGLAPGMQAVSSFINAGTASPRATVQTVGWAMYHGDLATLTGLLKLDPKGEAAAALVYQGLPANARALVDSPEEMMAALIIYGYPTGVGFQFTGDHQLEAGPNDWSVEGQAQWKDGRSGKVQFRVQNVAGRWMLVAGPSNVAGLGRLLIDPGSLSPPAD
jgi:beta-lactamase regulating signal transducer with metallopeptidase domain